MLDLQGLARPPGRRFALDDPLEAMIDRLALVQVDSVPHVERAHHMILHARSQAYRPRDLARLQATGRVWEGWTHDASYLPASHWPCWKHRFRRTAPRLAERFRAWQGAECLDGADRLLDRIRADGPLRARDLDEPRPKAMWQWPHGKAALEWLWRTGRLAIAGRDRGFHKVYDLAERVIPSEHWGAEVSEEAFVDWSCRTALDRLGWATPAQLAGFYNNVSVAEARAWLAATDLPTVTVDGRPFAARPDIGERMAAVPDMPRRLRVLSPFDPVLRDRERLQWLWNFRYRIEIYVPAARRVWGYYVFPMLEEDRVIGRIDVQALRREGVLDVRRFWLEPGVRWGEGRERRLEAELVRLARLAGVEAVRWSGERRPSARPE